MEKFDQHMIGNYNRLADIYNRMAEAEKAIDARCHAIALNIQEITGKDCDPNIEYSVIKIAEKYPDIPELPLQICSASHTDQRYLHKQ